MKSWAPTAWAASITWARRRSGHGVADVLEDGAGEQERLLQDHGDVPAERGLGEIAHILAADQDLAAPDVVEAVQQRHRAGLAGAGRADQRHRLARLDPKADVAQHRDAVDVAEGDVLELDRAVDALGIERARPVTDVDRHVQDLEDPLPRRHGPLHDAVLHGERPDRVEEALDVEQEGDHHAEVELAAQHRDAADHDHDAHGGAGQRVDDRDHDLGEPGAAQLGIQIVRDLLLEQLEVDRLAPHALHGADAMDAFRQRAVQGRAGDPRAQKGAPRARQPDDAHADQDRHDREGEEPEAPVEDQEHDRDAEQQDEVAEREHRGLEELLQGVDVALQARHQASDLGLVHERQRDPLQVGEHRAPQIDQQPLGDARDQGLLDQIGEEVEADDAEKHQRRRA